MTIAEWNEPLVSGLINVITAKGLKMKYVAQKAGYTSQELSDMLNGRRLIKAADIPRLTKALGVEVNDLFAEPEKGEE